MRAYPGVTNMLVCIHAVFNFVAGMVSFPLAIYVFMQLDQGSTQAAAIATYLLVMGFIQVFQSLIIGIKSSARVAIERLCLSKKAFNWLDKLSTVTRGLSIIFIHALVACGLVFVLIWYIQSASTASS